MKTRGIGFAHFIPLKHLRVDGRLGQLGRYTGVEIIAIASIKCGLNADAN